MPKKGKRKELIRMKKNEKLFEEFLEEYLENVKKKLPDSFRAKQLKAGGLEAGLVYKFETDFLKEPFMKAVKKISKEHEKEKKK